MEWGVLHDGLCTVSKSYLENFRRGRQFEDTARQKFVKDSGFHVEECGIFFRAAVGASPDGLICTQDDDWLLEIKTRVVNAAGPLEKINTHMYTQVQVQLFLHRT